MTGNHFNADQLFEYVAILALLLCALAMMTAVAVWIVTRFHYKPLQRLDQLTITDKELDEIAKALTTWIRNTPVIVEYSPRRAGKTHRQEQLFMATTRDMVIYVLNSLGIKVRP